MKSMKNKVRLLVSFVVVVVIWLLNEFLLAGIIGRWLLNLAGIWFVIECIIFSTKYKYMKNALPIITVVWFVIGLLSWIFSFPTAYDLIISPFTEARPFLPPLLLWVFYSVIVFPILGIFYLVSGKKMLKNKENRKSAIFKLILGAILLLLIILFILFLSNLGDF